MKLLIAIMLLLAFSYAFKIRVKQGDGMDTSTTDDSSTYMDPTDPAYIDMSCTDETGMNVACDTVGTDSTSGSMDNSSPTVMPGEEDMS